MSHGPSIRVYGLSEKQFDKKSNNVVDFMKVVDVGTKKEREYVAKYINNMLFDRREQYEGGFAFWNHREGQEVEDYDILCDLFESYGKIISHVCLCTSIVQADYRDYTLFSEDGNTCKIDDEICEDLDVWTKKLSLKAKIFEGERAEKELKELEEQK